MSWLLKLSFVFAIAGHGADLATTEHCLGAQQCHELNVWLARFDQPAAFGVAKMGVAGLSEIGVYELAQNHPRLAFWTNMAIGASFSAVAIHNGHQEHR